MTTYKIFVFKFENDRNIDFNVKFDEEFEYELDFAPKCAVK